MIAPTLTATVTLLAAVAPHNWRSVTPLAVSVNGEAYVRVRLPATIDPGPSGDYADVRIIDDRNSEVPYALDAQHFPPAPPSTARLQLDAAHEIRGSSEQWIFENSGAFIGSSEAVFSAEQAAFERSVTIEASDDGGAWGYLASGSVKQFANGERSLRLRWPLTYARIVRVTIENADNEPVAGMRPTLAGPAHTLVFRGAPGRTYRLLSGNASARAPAYDLPDLLAHEQWQEAAAAPFARRPSEKRTHMAIPSKAPLAAVFAICCLLLGTVIVCALRGQAREEEGI